MFEDDSDSQQGRVAVRLIWVYDEPSLNARRVNLHWRDTILTVSGITISKDEGDYNRVWYEIGTEGYAYSGTIQPVHTLLNAPSLEVPVSGALAAVMVSPFHSKVCCARTATTPAWTISVRCPAVSKLEKVAGPPAQASTHSLW